MPSADGIASNKSITEGLIQVRLWPRISMSCPRHYDQTYKKHSLSVIQYLLYIYCKHAQSCVRSEYH